MGEYIATSVTKYVKRGLYKTCIKCEKTHYCKTFCRFHYDQTRQALPEYKERQRIARNTPEAKAKQRLASKKYRSTEEYRVKKAGYRAMQKHKDKRRDTILKQTFGISLDDYKQMLEAQNGVCAICLDIDPVRSLAVDHCHATGKIRGLLCRNCNQGLGQYRDDPENLIRAAKYLRG